jgi:hypothetical protein
MGRVTYAVNHVTTAHDLFNPRHIAKPVILTAEVEIDMWLRAP